MFGHDEKTNQRGWNEKGCGRIGFIRQRDDSREEADSDNGSERNVAEEQHDEDENHGSCDDGLGSDRQKRTEAGCDAFASAEL